MRKCGNCGEEGNLLSLIFVHLKKNLRDFLKVTTKKIAQTTKQSKS
jgi:hypothetical protein